MEVRASMPSCVAGASVARGNTPHDSCERWSCAPSPHAANQSERDGERGSLLHPMFSTGSSRLWPPIRSGSVTPPLSGRAKAGCMWRRSWLCFRAWSSAGPWGNTTMRGWSAKHWTWLWCVVSRPPRCLCIPIRAVPTPVQAIRASWPSEGSW